MFASRLLRQLPAHQTRFKQAVRPQSIINSQIARSFHASAPRTSALDTFLVLPHELLHLIHAAVPWYAAIPASAFIVRALLVTTFGSRVRSLTARWIALQPLRQAIALQKRDELAKKGGFANPGEALKVVRREVAKETRALDKRWHCTLAGQLNWTLLQLPLFLVMQEVIRRMIDMRVGLLGMAMNAVGLGPSSAQEEVLVSGETMDAATHLQSSSWFEPSLGTEGMLWFPDLLVADPTGALPFVVSGLMFFNVWTTSNTSDKIGRSSPFTRGLRRGLLGISLLIGPLAQSVPAGLLLYWASSTTSVILWNKWLDWKYPAPEGMSACKRPLLKVSPRSTPALKLKGSQGSVPLSRLSR